MKKILIPILMLLPLATLQAQSVLTPQQQLEEAQKKLEEAKKAVEEAKQAKLQAEKAEEEAKKAEEANRKAEAEKIQQQIKAAEAEAERLRNEAEKINAEAAKATENAKAGKAAESTKAEKAGGETGKAAKTTETKAGGWVIPTAPAKTESKKEKPASVPTTANGVKLKEDPKYLEGAVPTDENGKVEFVENIQAPGKSAAQLYDIVYEYMTQLTQDKNSIGNRIALVNSDKHVIANAMDEWIVFSSSFISLDRTEAKYNLIAEITDGNVKLTINHINYTYEEGRSTGFKSSAEDVISDKVALTKKKNDLARIFGKFRKKTIDRKDQIFSGLKDLVK